MKKFTEILSYIVTFIFVVGGLFLIIAVIGALMELFSYSPSTGLDGVFGTLIFIGIAAIAFFAFTAIGGGSLSFFLIRTANKQFAGDENKTERIILKCIAYAILIIITIIIAKFIP